MTGEKKQIIPVIYGLFDPCDKSLRYIGKANNPEKRLKGHIQASTKKNIPSSRWIRRLLAAGLIPELKIIEVCDARDWQTAEKDHISKALANGEKLLNVSSGGDQPYNDPKAKEEHGRRLAKAIHSDPVRKRLWALKKDLGVALKLGQPRDSTKEKLRAAARRHPEMLGRFANI